MLVKYDNHAAEWAETLCDPDRLAHSQTWFEADRVDSWRHRRMHDEIRPIIAHARDRKWLTVGDGRYGADAHYLIEQGVGEVHASDIVDTMLRVGAQRGFIASYSAQNAESLTFADDAFDYVYCKETYHHLPRPWLAVYEMLRVAREAVILTEPNDAVAPLRLPAQLARTALRSLRKLLRRAGDPHVFEPVGNYVYAVSEWEIRKSMLGLGLRYCAFKGINDHYVPGAEQALLRHGTREHRRIKKQIERRIARDDLLCQIGLKKPTLITAVLFKAKPADALWAALQRAGYDTEILPANPYA